MLSETGYRNVSIVDSQKQIDLRLEHLWKRPRFHIEQFGSNVPGPLVLRGTRRCHMDDEERAICEYRSRYGEFLVRVHKGPNPTERLVLRR